MKEWNPDQKVSLNERPEGGTEGRLKSWREGKPEEPGMESRKAGKKGTEEQEGNQSED